MSYQAIVDELLAETGASRCTLRQSLPGQDFPVTHEALAPGVAPLEGFTGVVQHTQPVIKQMQETHAQVVQHDSASAFDDPDFHRMRELYGGLAAQIVTPVVVDGEIRAVVSLHQLGSPREWTEREQELCRRAAERVRLLLEQQL